MDRGGWRATVHGITKSQTRLKRLSVHVVLHRVVSLLSKSSVLLLSITPPLLMLVSFKYQCTFLFCNSFRVSDKLQRCYTELLYTPQPVSLTGNIFHFTLVKTKTLTFNQAPDFDVIIIFCYYPLQFPDPAQSATLHLVVMSSWSPLVWDLVAVTLGVVKMLIKYPIEYHITWVCLFVCSFVFLIISLRL